MFYRTQSSIGPLQKAVVRVAVCIGVLMASATVAVAAIASNTRTTANPVTADQCTSVMSNEFPVPLGGSSTSRGRSGSSDFDCKYWDVSIGGQFNNAFRGSSTGTVNATKQVFGNVKTTSGSACDAQGFCISWSVTRP